MSLKTWMSLNTWLGFLLIPCMNLTWAENFNSLNEASGVNLSAGEGFGARHSGMAISFAGFQKDADAVANAPAAMNDIDDFTFTSAHAEKFGEAKFDNLAFLLPFEANSTLGLGLSRYGISGVELRPEGATRLQSQAPEVFSVADYLIVAGFARRWAGFDFGLNFNLLYRQLDQDGIGMRGDGMVQYTWQDKFRVGALLKGLVPASAAWESGYSEYEPSDLYLGASARFPTPYFYGSMQVAFETEGLFQKQSRSLAGQKGDRIYESPAEIFSTANFGIEYLFDFGLAARFGMQELTTGSALASVTTFGIGYNWRKIIGLDYSFTPHPELLSTHRISVQFTPVFPKFNGKGFRPHKEASNTFAPKDSNPLKSIPQPEVKPGLKPDVKQPSIPEAKEILEQDEEELEQ